MTTTQRDAITGIGLAQKGLLIFNTTTDSFNYWDGTNWIDLVSGSEWTDEGDYLRPSDGNTEEIAIGTNTNEAMLTVWSTLTTNNDPAVSINKTSNANDVAVMDLSGDFNGLGGQGIHSILNGGTSSTRPFHGILNQLNVDGLGNVFGVENDLTTIDNTGETYAILNTITNNNTTSPIYGARTNITSSTTTDKYGTYNHLINSNGNKYGTYNQFENGASGTTYGTYNVFESGLTGNRYGLYNSFQDYGASGNQTKVGVLNQTISNATDRGDFFGVQSNFDNNTSGGSYKYGMQNNISGSALRHYGMQNNFTRATTLVGLENNFDVSSSTIAYGVYNDFSTSTTSSNASVTGLITYFRDNLNNSSASKVGYYRQSLWPRFPILYFGSLCEMLIVLMLEVYK